MDGCGDIAFDKISFSILVLYLLTGIVLTYVVPCANIIINRFTYILYRGLTAYVTGTLTFGELCEFSHTVMDDDSNTMLIEENNEDEESNKETKHIANEFYILFCKIGATIIVLSSVSIILGILGICYDTYWSPMSVTGCSIWCGVMGLLCGIVCLIFRCHKSKKCVFWVYLFSILSSIFGTLLVILESIETIRVVSFMSPAFGEQCVIHSSLTIIATVWAVLSIYICIVFSKLYKQINPTCECSTEAGAWFRYLFTGSGGYNGYSRKNVQYQPIMVYAPSTDLRKT